jgi:PIN domain nuclease of toxin-antitoxin system
MRCFIDTHIFIWALSGSLSDDIFDIVTDYENHIYKNNKAKLNAVFIFTKIIK